MKKFGPVIQLPPPRKYKDKVRWEFKIAIGGHGRNCKEALRSAAENLLSIIDDFGPNDLGAIEEFETVLIDETDVEE